MRERERLAQDIEDAEFDYDYPGDLGDLRPKSNKHKFIVQEVMDRVRESLNMFHPYKHDMRRMDWSLTSYMPADEADAAVKGADWRKPVNVVVPITSASLEMYLTYFTSVFLGSPIHRYRGMGGQESIIAAAKHELLVDRQAQWFGYGLRHQTHLRDAMAYGRGLMALEWYHHKARRPISVELEPFTYEAMKDILPSSVKEGDWIRLLREHTLYEGTKLRNVDPYRCIYDPNVAPNDIQDGTFVGWMYRTDSEQLLKREFEPESRMFNAKYAHLWANKGHGYSCYYDDYETGRNTATKTEDLDSSMVPQHKRRVDVVTLYIDIIPSEWGLGDEDYPVKWMFSVAGDRILIQCEPCDYMHGMFPVVAAAPNTDGYSVFPVSHLMSTYGMQLTVDFLNKSHMDNIRKAINDMIIFDPTAIEEEDIKNPGPGKLIRLARSHMNRGVSIDQYIKQLNVTDVTRGHAEDMMRMIDLMRQANGTVDITMGDLSKLPERPTEAGINAATSGALSRLQRLASIYSEQTMTPLGLMLAYNNVQYLDAPMSVPITGRHEEMLMREYPELARNGGFNVAPDDLDVNIQVVPYDGSRSEPNDLASLDQMMQILLQVPENVEEISKRYPIAQVFSQWLRKRGATDIAEMQQNIQQNVMPDEELAREVERGNLVSAQDVSAMQQQYGAVA